MRESFLHFIWQFQKFNTIELTTHDGLSVQIYAIGHYNTNAGPDFLNAKLLIDDIMWYGHIELHIRSSDWNKHKHQHDEAYNNVVLHVVWEHDIEVQSVNGASLPVLELQDRIHPELLRKCNQLIKSPEQIPCAAQFGRVRDIDKLSMLDQMGVQRLKQKSEVILNLLEKNKGSWEETTYQLLAKNFGFKTNDEPFLKLAQSLHHKTLIKHAGQPLPVAALIFGMAGFLHGDLDTYGHELNKEYDYLSKKYKLQGFELLQAEWKYLRLRPGNFPTVRLAQFAAFMTRNVKCFDQFIHYQKTKDLLTLFEVDVDDYWQQHYDFGKASNRSQNAMGKSSIDLILINTVAPLLASYSQYTDEISFMDKAIDLLQTVKAERNHILTMWGELGFQVKDAFDSQALIELRNEFCLKKKCLSCKIGVNLINS
ncbi:DUF2851 family protein [Reichenbachiella carrageenanivorans]|uniref:DUF2851 family protein n=1 Tax=Reichenbachiella carrageenanivorans TaxID=2979869 RepID=A0ABY6D3L0_9BACT|nr:DUF2851 family protein [Reichenbachiella carrageenanivorans]UXX80708.1 DUF2851 family protein [Reichenbachiella carrageenanivorans]